MALVFQTMPYQVVGNRPEENGEQYQNADCLVEAQYLIFVHKFITVLSCCTIGLAVLYSNVAEELIRVGISTVVQHIVVARKFFTAETENCINAS